MRIYLHEITDQEMEYDFTQNDSWVIEAVERVDEEPWHTAKPAPSAVVRPASAAPLKTPGSPPRTVEAHLSLRKVDEVIVISGNIHTSVRLLCSRCATPFDLECNPRISALFCKDPVMAGVAHIQESGRNKGKPTGQTKGFARHAHDESSDHEEGAGGAGMDLDITYLSEDYIELGDILTEQLQLQVPFQPLCGAECKGLCLNCGTDLNSGRCACAKLNKASPFAALQSLKPELKL